MFPRKPLFFWQEIAHAPCVARSGFASTRLCLQDESMSRVRVSGRASQCDPIPSIWSGPCGAGPFFCASAHGHPDRRGLADGAGRQTRLGCISAFVTPAGSLDSCGITTPLRGTTTCGKSSLFSSSQPRLPAACRTPVRARRQVPLLALWLRTQPKATWSMARSSAVWPVRRPAPFRARSAADETTLTAAAAGLNPIPATRGAFPAGGFFISRPMAALT